MTILPTQNGNNFRYLYDTPYTHCSCDAVTLQDLLVIGTFQQTVQPNGLNTKRSYSLLNTCAYYHTVFACLSECKKCVYSADTYPQFIWASFFDVT